MGPRQALVVPPKFCLLTVTGNADSWCGMKWSLQGPDPILKMNLKTLQSLMDGYPGLKGGPHDVLKANLIAQVGGE